MSTNNNDDEYVSRITVMSFGVLLGMLVTAFGIYVYHVYDMIW